MEYLISVTPFAVGRRRSELQRRPPAVAYIV